MDTIIEEPESGREDDSYFETYMGDRKESIENVLSLGQFSELFDGEEAEMEDDTEDTSNENTGIYIFFFFFLKLYYGRYN